MKVYIFFHKDYSIIRASHVCSLLKYNCYIIREETFCLGPYNFITCFCNMNFVHYYWIHLFTVLFVSRWNN